MLSNCKEFDFDFDSTLVSTPGFLEKINSLYKSSIISKSQSWPTLNDVSNVKLFTGPKDLTYDIIDVLDLSIFDSLHDYTFNPESGNTPTTFIKVRDFPEFIIQAGNCATYYRHPLDLTLSVPKTCGSFSKSFAEESYPLVTLGISSSIINETTFKFSIINDKESTRLTEIVFDTLLDRAYMTRDGFKKFSWGFRTDPERTYELNLNATKVSIHNYVGVDKLVLPHKNEPLDLTYGEYFCVAYILSCIKLIREAI